MGDVQPERGLAGGGRRGARKASPSMVEHGGGGGLLPRAQRPGGGPGRQGAARRGARRSVDLVRHGTQQLRRRVGRCRRVSQEPENTRCCTLNDRVSPSDPLLRPRLPLGLVGLSCHRRAEVALWRPARLARRDDRPDRERLRLRGSAATRPPARRAATAPSASAGCRSRPSRASGSTARGRCAASSSPRAGSPPSASTRSSARCSSRSSRARSTSRTPKDLLEAIAWVPGIDAEAIIAAADDPETETLFEAGPRPGPHGRGQPDRVPGQARQHRRPRPLHGAEHPLHQRAGHDARGRRLPDLRGLRRADRQPRPDAHPPRARRRTSPRSSRPSRTA